MNKSLIIDTIFSRTTVATFAVIALAVGAPACAAEPSDGDHLSPGGGSSSTRDRASTSDSAGDEGDPNDVFTQTVVTQREDGTFDMSTHTVTRAQQNAERARMLAHFTNDPTIEIETNVQPRDFWSPSGCTGAPLQVFDEPNFNGNSMCFAKITSGISTSLDLETVARLVDNCGTRTWFDYPGNCIYDPGAKAWSIAVNFPPRHDKEMRIQSYVSSTSASLRNNLNVVIYSIMPGATANVSFNFSDAVWNAKYLGL